MVKTFTRLYSHNKNDLHDLVKTNLSIEEKDYLAEEMTLTK